MSEIFFVIKISVITLVLIFLLQIKIGEDTLENQALFALRGSPMATELQGLGEGGWKEFRKQMSRWARGIGEAFGSRAEERLKTFSFGRSQAHLEEEARKREEEKARRDSPSQDPED